MQHKYEEASTKSDGVAVTDKEAKANEEEKKALIKALEALQGTRHARENVTISKGKK